MSKKNLTLGGVLLLLILCAYIYQGPLQTWKARRGQPDNFFSKIDFTQIDKIEIVANGATSTLEKLSDRWGVAGYKNFFVNQNLITEIFDKLDQIKKVNLELAGKTKENKAWFMTDDSGMKINLYQKDNQILDFIIGKMSNDYLGTYLGRSETTDSFYANVDLFSVFSQEDWRDKTIFASDKTKISKLRFQYPGREFSVEKNGEEWQGVSPRKFSVASEKINKVLDVMSNLFAVAVPEQKFKGTDLEKNLIIVSASGEGINNTIMIGKSDKDGFFYAKRADSDNIYLITEEQQEILNQKIELLK
jgi:hypothetical protein